MFNLNSTMVRLKPSTFEREAKGYKNLNSTMVRLKLYLRSHDNIVTGGSQFHYGSIKTHYYLNFIPDKFLISIPLWFD